MITCSEHFAVPSYPASPPPILAYSPHSLLPSVRVIALKLNPGHFTSLLKNSPVAFNFFQSRIMSSYDLPCSDFKHSTLSLIPCYFSGFLAVPQTLQAHVYLRAFALPVLSVEKDLYPDSFCASSLPSLKSLLYVTTSERPFLVTCRNSFCHLCP